MNLLTYLHLPRLVNGSGVGRVARHLSEELARTPGVNMHILGEMACYERIRVDLGGPLGNSTHHLFRAGVSRQQAQWLAAQRPAAEDFWPECDVVWCPAESYVPVRSAALVVTIHDLAYFEDRAVGKLRTILLQRLKSRILFEVLARRADIFHVVSAFTADRLAHFFPAVSSRIRIVPNGLTPRFADPPSAAGESEQKFLGLTKRYVLLPGGLNWKKNADAVLAAWPKIKRECWDLELVVVGTSSPLYSKSLARESGVRILGYVNDELLRSLYGGASLVWIPSRYEGFAIPLLEAMACGVPVVASSSGAIPEVAGDAVLLVGPGSPNEHVDAIVSVLRNEDLRLQLKTRGLSRVSRFSWSASAQQLLSVFHTSRNRRVRLDTNENPR